MLRRLLLCYLAAGCTTWRAIPPAGLPPSTPVAYYDRVRVVRHDRSWMELREARVDTSRLEA